MEEKTYPQTWYVYTYAHPVDMGGAIFYIGKGTGARMLAHEMEARSGCVCAKCDVIRSIWASGKTVQKSIVFETFVEVEAYQRESELIQKHAATLANIKGIPEEVRKERNLKEFERIVGQRERYKSPLTQVYAKLESACKYCRLGPGIFIHYSGLFGLKEYPDGRFSGYREEDLIRFNAWMQRNYPLVGSARRELLEQEERRARMSSAEI